MATIGQALATPESGWYRHNYKLLQRTEGWTEQTGLFIYTTSPTPKCTFTFKGTKLRIIGSCYYDNRTTANGRIKINGILEPTKLNEKLSKTEETILIYEKLDLPYGEHTVELYCEDSYQFRINAVDIDESGFLIRQIGDVSEIPDKSWKRYDDSHVGINYTGSWQKATLGYNNTRTYTTIAGDKITIKFYGSKFRLIGDIHPDRLIEESNIIMVDGIEHGRFSQYGIAQKFMILQYEVSDLEIGNHTIEIISNGAFLIDAVDVDDVGYLIPERKIGEVLATPDEGWKRYDDSHVFFKYTGSWVKASGGYDSSRIYTSTPGDKVVIKFFGSRFRFIGDTNIDRPNFKTNMVYVDGVENGGFSQYASSNSIILQYEVLNLNLGVHTIEIIANGVFVVDALDIDEEGLLLDEDGMIKLTDYKTSSQENDFMYITESVTPGSYPAWKAFDNTTTYWYSHPNNPITLGGIWLDVKLKQKTRINKIMIKPMVISSGNTSIKDFEIQVSKDNGGLYTTIYEGTLPNGSNENFIRDVGIGEDVTNVRFLIKNSYWTYVGAEEISFYKTFDGPPKFDLNGPLSGVYGLEPIIISGTATDIEGNVNIDIENNDIIIETISEINGVFQKILTPETLSIGENRIKITVKDSSLNSVFIILYILKSESNIIIYNKKAITKEILIPQTANSLVLSAIAEGQMIAPCVSIDSGVTWILGDWEEEIPIPQANSVKLMFLMSQDFILKAYGVGWFTNI